MWIVSLVCIGTRMSSPSTSLIRSVNNNYNSANRAQVRFLSLCRSKLDELFQVILIYILFLVSIFTVHSDNVWYHRYKWRRLSMSLGNSFTMSTHTKKLPRKSRRQRRTYITWTIFWEYENLCNLKKKSSQNEVT